MKEQKKASAGQQEAKTKKPARGHLISLLKDSKNLLNHQTINELFIVVAFLSLIGLILLKGGTK